MGDFSFDTIPLNLLTPGQYVEFSTARANAGLLVQRKRTMAFGQRLTAGSVAAGVPVRVTSGSQAELFFGRGAQLTRICKAFIANAPFEELWAVASDDNAAGVAATGSIALTGTATAAGTLQVYIAGQRLQVGVALGATAATVATALAAAINALTSLPLTAAAATGTVTLTARHKGDCGNVDVRLNYNRGDSTPSGIAATITALTNGATNPSVATSIAVSGAQQYTTFIMPWADATNLTAMEQELLTRWGGLYANDGHFFYGVPGSYAAIDTVGVGRNSAFGTLMPGQGSPTPVYELAAMAAGQDAAESDPARPRQTLQLVGALAPDVTARYTRAERNVHLLDGIASWTVDDDGTCRIERLVTTYKTSTAGVPDPSYRDIETMRTLSYIRFQLRAAIALAFPRHKLAATEGNYSAGQPIATPLRIKAVLINVASLLEQAAVIEDVVQFKRDLQVQVSSTDPNRAESIVVPNLVNQLRVSATQIQFIV